MNATTEIFRTTIEILQIPEPPASRWHRAGMGKRGERVFNAASGFLVLLFVAGWSWSIAQASIAREEGDPTEVSEVTSLISTALTDPDAPSVAYLANAAVEALTPLRGSSGKLQARVQQAGARVMRAPLPSGTDLTFADSALSARVAAGTDSASLAAPGRAGIWQLAVKVGTAIKPITDFNVITLTPFSAKRGGRIGLYYLGIWPTERARSGRDDYRPPSGFIEVTRENQHTRLSEHFRLRDFLTHDQEGVWPKYLVVDTKLVDKLELVLSDLESRGVRVAGVKVMSGFRTPQYNRGGGNPRGRAALSRHMFGDAADIFIDNNGDGNMDDLNGDRRVNIRDAQVLQAAVDRVEREHPALVGGCGVYVASGGHGPFTHIDTRGFRARWVGRGDG